MPDISMCTSDNCPVKDTCYRKMAKASSYQCYFMEPPLKEDGTCDYYWKIVEKDTWSEVDPMTI